MNVVDCKLWVTELNDGNLMFSKKILATHLADLCDPLSGRDPQFGKRWRRRMGYACEG